MFYGRLCKAVLKCLDLRLFLYVVAQVKCFEIDFCFKIDFED